MIKMVKMIKMIEIIKMITVITGRQQAPSPLARAVHSQRMRPAEGAGRCRWQTGGYFCFGWSVSTVSTELVSFSKSEPVTRNRRPIFLPQGVTFYYGISPGQDMRYCEQKEQDLLVAKTRSASTLYLSFCCSTCSSLRQLQELGCKGFAVLWDDIEPELTEEDAKHFTSFAEAHCKVILPRPRLNTLLVLSNWPKKFISTTTASEPISPKSGYSGDKQFARNSSTSKDASLSRRVLLVPRCPRSAWVLKAMSYVDSFLELFNQM